MLGLSAPESEAGDGLADLVRRHPVDGGACRRPIHRCLQRRRAHLINEEKLWTYCSVTRDRASSAAGSQTFCGGDSSRFDAHRDRARAAGLGRHGDQDTVIHVDNPRSDYPRERAGNHSSFHLWHARMQHNSQAVRTDSAYRWRGASSLSRTIDRDAQHCQWVRGHAVRRSVTRLQCIRHGLQHRMAPQCSWLPLCNNLLLS